ncbi:Ig-like domain-containing protein [Marinimicrobium alkaliphilum]|uniref:hypothetical protein n=1 Tax=Marinimicrobium alkaliphilum TaxID=2202654 RepID=UPI000DB9D8EB|nr:hypothetical protein [Marinimicrobium alkaliphilum]
MKPFSASVLSGHHTRTLKALATCAILAVLAGCGGGSGDSNGGGATNGNGNGGAASSQSSSSSSDNDSDAPVVGSPPETHPEGADLSEVTVASDTVRSLYRVELLGLPDDVDPDSIHAEYYVISALAPADYADHGFLPAFSLKKDFSDEESDTGIYLPTPLIDEDEGSSLVVVITDGLSRSAAIQLNLNPLPAPRQNAFHELVDEIDNLLRVATETLGRTYPDEWEQWRNSGLNQMPEYLLPIMLTWHGVMDMENESSIARQLEEGLEPEVLALLERILATDDLPAAIREQTEILASGDSPLNHAAELDIVMTNSIEWQDSRQFQRAHPSGTVTTQDLSAREATGVPTLPNAEALAPLLALHRDFRHRQQSAELFDDTVGSYVKGLGLVATVAAGVSTAGSGAAVTNTARAKTLGLVGNAITGFSRLNEVAQWFLPCCITDMTTTLNPAGGQILNEDASIPQVRLASATGRAESIGVDVTREVLSSLTAELSSRSIGAFFNDIYPDSNGAAGNVANFVLSDVTKSIIDQFPQGQKVVFVWNGIDLMGEEAQKWLEVETDTFGSGGEPFLFQTVTSNDRFEFQLSVPRAFEIQSSQLRFSTNHETLASARAIHTSTVDLNHIEITFSPERIRISDDELGTTIPFSVTVNNSALHAQDEPFIDLILEPEPAVGDIFYVDENPRGTHNFEYDVPDEFPEGVVVEVRTESISNSLPTHNLRAPENDPPPRTGVMFISSDAIDVMVEPASVCILPGETVQFRALSRDTGEAVDEVEWSVDSGSISGNGAYTAANDNAIIVARAGAGGPGVGRATVGDCSCYFDASLSGHASVSRAGFSYLSLGRDSTAHTDLRFFGHEGSAASTTMMMLDLDPPLLLGSSGPTTTTTRSSGFVGGHAFVLFGPDGQLPALTVDITERSPVDNGPTGSVFLAGHIHGGVNVLQTPPEEPVPAQLNIQFNGIYRIATAGPALNCDPDF